MLNQNRISAMYMYRHNIIKLLEKNQRFGMIYISIKVAVLLNSTHLSTYNTLYEKFNI